MGFLILIGLVLVGWIGYSTWRSGTVRVWVSDIDCITSTTDATTRLVSNTRRGDAFLGRETCTVPNEEAKMLVERAKVLGLSLTYSFGSERLVENAR